MRMMLKSKIHHARVTARDLNYIGSIFIDEALLEKANILPYEKVEVINVSNGNRWETYAGAAQKGSGIVSVNGGGARLCYEGDLLIILAYEMTERLDEKPTMIRVDHNNHFVEYLS